MRGEEHRAEKENDDDENVDRRILCVSACVLNLLAPLEYNIVLLSSFISPREKNERRTNVCHYSDAGQTYT